jgi:hypothetical protein
MQTAFEWTEQYLPEGLAAAALLFALYLGGKRFLKQRFQHRESRERARLRREFWGWE